MSCMEQFYVLFFQTLFCFFTQSCDFVYVQRRATLRMPLRRHCHTGTINTSRLADTSCLGQLLTVFPVAVIVFFELLLAFNIVVLSYSLLFLVNVPSYGHLQERCILISPCFCLNWCTLGPQQPTQCCSPRSRGGWSSRSSAE